jgi:hypothetical protein
LSLHPCHVTPEGILSSIAIGLRSPKNPALSPPARRSPCRLRLCSAALCPRPCLCVLLQLQTAQTLGDSRASQRDMSMVIGVLSMFIVCSLILMPMLSSMLLVGKSAECNMLPLSLIGLFVHAAPRSPRHLSVMRVPPLSRLLVLCLIMMIVIVLVVLLMPLLATRRAPSGKLMALRAAPPSLSGSRHGTGVGSHHPWPGTRACTRPA